MPRIFCQLWIAAALTLLPALALAGDYEDAFARAAALEEQRDYRGALAELEPLVDDYPQDYALHLQIAWLGFQAGDYEAAERSYRRAHALSDGALQPTLGLGWTLLRQGRADEAGAYFEEAKRQAPDDPSAIEGLAAVDDLEQRQAIHVDIFAGGVARSDVFPSQTSWSGGPMVGLGLSRDRFVAGATYRMFAYDVETQGSEDMQRRHGAAWDATELATQHEIYGALAYGSEYWGVSGHYGHVQAGLEGGLDADMAAAVGRVGLFGEVTFEASYTLFPDVDILRLAPTWRIPLGELFYARPAGAYQWVSDTDDSFVVGSLGVGLSSQSLRVEVGGKYGEEWRPSYAGLSVIYNVDAVIEGGAWTSIAVKIAPGWRLVGDYAYENYRATTTSTLSDGHVASAGLEVRMR